MAKTSSKKNRSADKTSPNKKRIRQKQYCKYCNKQFAQLPRHLQTHKEHSETAKLPFYSPKRKRLILEKIRKEGAYLQNSSSDGKQIISSRVHLNSSKELRTCKFCKGSFSKKWIAHHKYRCNLKAPNQIRHRPNYEPDKLLNEYVLKNMNQDVVYEVIIKDDLILKFGSRVLYRNTKDTDAFHNVSSKMRELGRLMYELKSKHEIDSLEKAIAPSNFNKLVDAVKVISGFNAFENSFKIPSLPAKIGYSLRECCTILEVEAAMQENNLYIDQLQTFLVLYEKEYPHLLTRHARQILVENKWNNFKKLPEAVDIEKLLDHLESNQKTLIDELESSPSPNPAAYKSLRNLTLAHLVVFNRKRVGEVSKVKRSTMTMRNPSAMDNGTNEMLLDGIEEKLMSFMTRIEIRGKKKRGVPLLLTPHMVKCVDILEKYRHFFIPENNIYFFANNTNGFIRGSDVLRRVTMECEVQNITSTTLRKHLATTAQIMSLDSSQLERLADFMGHRLDVHKDFYRLSNDIQDKSKLIKLFLCLRKGTKYINNIKNKTFDNIVITDEMLQELLTEDIEEEEEEDEDADDKEVSNGTKKQGKPKAKPQNEVLTLTDDIEEKEDADDKEVSNGTKKQGKSKAKPQKVTFVGPHTRKKQIHFSPMLDKNMEDDSDADKSNGPKKQGKPKAKPQNEVLTLTEDIEEKEDADDKEVSNGTKKQGKPKAKPQKVTFVGPHTRKKQIHFSPMLDKNMEDDSDADKTYEPKMYSTNQPSSTKKKWVKWSPFEEKILNKRFRTEILLGNIPSSQEILDKVVQDLPNRKVEEIRQKIRRMAVEAGKLIGN
ncbi:hypothetical protein WDU94_015616 [Cyamophila willieti]